MLNFFRTDKPFFSIVIPTLNEESVIAGILTDLSEQTFINFSCTIVDSPNSNDNLKKIVEGFSKKWPQIKYVSAPKGGVSAQRNFGAKTTPGEYFIFFDADVRVGKIFLEGVHYHILHTGAKAGSAAFVAGSKETKDKVIFSIINYVFRQAAMLGQPMAFGACLFAHHKAFEAIKGFDEKLSFLEDVDFQRRLVARDVDFAYFQDPEYVYSMRRMKSEGLLQVALKSAPTVLKHILLDQKEVNTDDIYPMRGGKYYLRKQ